MDRQQIIQEFRKQVTVLLQGKASKVILYGSYARGDSKENSDVDIMVLTHIPEIDIEKAEDVLYDLSYDFFLKYFVNISVIVKNEEHFNRWVNDLPFYHNVQQEGVVMYG